MLYKCQNECTSCISYNSIASRGVCTACIPGYDLISEECVSQYAICGDSKLFFPEKCDDGNLLNGDGCSNLCIIENGYKCFNAPSNCSPICGDALIFGNECED